MAPASSPQFTFRVATTSEDVAAAVAIEHSVFGERYGNTPEQLHEEYSPYADSSVFMLVVAAEVPGVSPGSICGMMRLIRPSHQGLKTTLDVKEDPWSLDLDATAEESGLDLTHAWDVATLAFLPVSRSPRTMMELCVFSFRFIASQDATGWVAILEERVFESMQARGLDIDVLPGAFAAPYLGSDASVPVYGRVPRQRRSVEELSPLRTPSGQ